MQKLMQIQVSDSEDMLRYGPHKGEEAEADRIKRVYRTFDGTPSSMFKFFVDGGDENSALAFAFAWSCSGNFTIPRKHTALTQLKSEREFEFGSGRPDLMYYRPASWPAPHQKHSMSCLIAANAM